MGRTPLCKWKGALARGRAVEGLRPIQIRGGRVHVGARRPHACLGRAKVSCTGTSSRPPAGSLAPARERKDGDLRVKSAPSGGHTQRPGRRRRLGGPGCGTCGPDRATVAAAQAPPRPSESRVPARARQAGREPRAAGGRGPGLTSAPIAGHSVPDRGTGIGGAVARGGTAAVAAPAAQRAGRAGAAAWAARRPELAPRCRRSRRRAQPARPPTGFLH